MARLLILSRYCAPNELATRQYGKQSRFLWLSEVGTITRSLEAALRPALGGSCPPEQRIASRIYRMWTSAFARPYLLGKATIYLTFCFSLFLLHLRHAGRGGDVFIVATDSPLLSATAAIARPAHIHWLQDLYPEVATALDISAPGPFLALLQNQHDVAIGHGMAAYLRGRGVQTYPRLRHA